MHSNTKHSVHDYLRWHIFPWLCMIYRSSVMLSSFMQYTFTNSESPHFIEMWPITKAETPSLLFTFCHIACPVWGSVWLEQIRLQPTGSRILWLISTKLHFNRILTKYATWPRLMCSFSRLTSQQCLRLSTAATSLSTYRVQAPFPIVTCQGRSVTQI